VGPALELRPRAVKSSLEELLGKASSREDWKTSESLSGSMLERVVIDGESFVVKHLHVDDDWIQRVQGDLFTKPLQMWRSGLFDALPASFDHTTVDVASGLGRNGWGCALLMRDVTPTMLRVEDGVIPMDLHLRFIDHMAELHAHFWDFRDTYGLFPMGNRYFSLTPLMSQIEAERGGTDTVPKLVGEGWQRIADGSPKVARVLLPLLASPFPLVEAQGRVPQTLIHSDWKAGNLGAHDDGRTVLLDWAFPGQAPGSLDIAWYVAVNCDLLPHSKEETIALYREALGRHGVKIGTWWDEWLDLGLLGLAVMMTWSKTGDELAWWEDAALRAVRYLG
jgi:hypothetical protein